MTEYTPTTEQVRKYWLDKWAPSANLDAQFDRWLNEIRAKAWTEGFDKGFYRGQILYGDYDASEAGIENPYEVV